MKHRQTESLKHSLGLLSLQFVKLFFYIKYEKHNIETSILTVILT